MRNTGVTVSLIVFMVLSLILGVTTYIGWKGASEKRMQVEAAKKATADAQSLKSSMESELKSVKEKLGYDAVDDPVQLADTMAADVTAALGAVEDVASYRDVVLRLGENQARKTVELTNYRALQGSAANIATLNSDMTAEQKKAYDVSESTIKTDHSNTIAGTQKSYNDLNAGFGAQKQELDDLVQSTNAQIADAKQQTADYKEAADGFQALNAELNQDLDLLMKKDFTRHSAEVVYADQFLRTARLNVGTLDGVKPLTTFSIYKPSALDMETEKVKGSVQVVRCIGDHLCEAKILEDEMSNPVQKGDLAYTPLWRPGKTIRYALAYNLDIDGDGLEDLDELINIIQSAGAEVGAYIDRDGNQVGELTTDLFAVVHADEHSVDLVAKAKNDVDNERQSKELVNQKFLLAAKDQGIRLIKLSDFLNMIGYKETGKISRYQSPDGLNILDDGKAIPEASDGVVAPIHQVEPDKAPKSTGIVAPSFIKDAEPAPVSDGKVSDYFFRKRTGNPAQK